MFIHYMIISYDMYILIYAYIARCSVIFVMGSSQCFVTQLLLASSLELMLLYSVLEGMSCSEKFVVLQRGRCLSQKLLDKRRNQAVLMAWTKKLLLEHDTSQHVGSFELICFMLQILSAAGSWSKEGIGANIGERVIHRISADDGDEDPDLKFDQRSLEVDLCHFVRITAKSSFAREMGSSKILPAYRWFNMF